MMNTNKRFLCIIGLIIVSSVIFYFRRYYHLTVELSIRNIVPVVSNIPLKPTLSLPTSKDLLLFYEKEFSRLELTPFRPTFHNRHLTLKLNLTLFTTEYFDYLKNCSTNLICNYKVICLQMNKTTNNSHSICDINLIFQIKILNSKEIQLTLLSNNASCTITLENKSDLIIINIHKAFPIENIFHFTHQWSELNHPLDIFWRSWPITTECIKSYLNQSLEITRIKSLPCSLTNILLHSGSKELFVAEQNAVSTWLDLQYEIFLDQRLPKQIHNRSLIPFELAKDPNVCSNQFQKWIFDYQKWHENLTFYINNGSMTIEEQRKRIIEEDVRFLIYEKHTSGIADRIIHLISTYLIALLTKRLFIFDKDWPEFTQIMQLSLNYEQKLIIPWIDQLGVLNKNFNSTDRNYLSSNSRWFSFDRFLQTYDYDKIFPERILIFKGHTGGVIQTLHSNSSIYRKFLTENLKMNTNNIFGCLYHSLFTYKLSELINRVPFNSSDPPIGHSSQFILQILLSPIFFPVGVQVRAGDGTMNENNIDQSRLDTNPAEFIERYENYVVCTQQMISTNTNLFQKTNRTPIIFLLSDSYEIRIATLKLKQLSLECYKSSNKECRLDPNELHVLASPNPVFHVSLTTNRVLAFQLGMFDIFLFSLCQQHLISTESGFGRFSAFASLKQRNIYSLALREKKSCQNDGLPLSSVGYHWSGI
ncbi:unnamed protein product [Adineta steineri]|uniref:Uncharacterized protein n=1 Tax=Adineta steineri TaxID=433720 RepID=A0A818ZI85_9BILA|nr:unnamed protein product [Adineta steineri]